MFGTDVRTASAFHHGRVNCGRVGKDRLYNCPASKVTLRGKGELRVTVRGSAGRFVRFRARDARSGGNLGRVSACIRVGHGSTLVWKNRSTRAKRVMLAAQICNFGSANVQANMYY